MKIRLYLDNCCFNRPFDDQRDLKIWLETQAKLYIQHGLLEGVYELAWSYVLDYEIGMSPFHERKEKFMQWKNIASCFCAEDETILLEAETLRASHFKIIDALHTACAIKMRCDYLITTDSKMLNKNVSNINIINPVDFILRKELRYEN